MAYTGNSIVDYLNSTGQASDYGSRSKLAASKGIAGYAGTAEQNTRLLTTLRGGGAAPVAQPTVTQTPMGTLTTIPKTSVSSYGGPSIVDYLNTSGKPSDYNSRATMATQYGIPNYVGSAEQNTTLLNYLRSGATPQQAMGAVYQATGVAPPPQPTTSANGMPSADAPDWYKEAMANAAKPPVYPTRDTQAASINEAHGKMTEAITAIEEKLKSATQSSPEEVKLQQDLAAAKARLGQFDTTIETRVNDMYGTGRGQTLSTIGLQETQERRSAALERLGLAQEADTLTTQLGLAQDKRKEMGDLASTEYNLATKRFDMALGVQDKLAKLDDQDRADARSYLLDVVAFSDGKNFGELDQQSQGSIMQAVANSPITLDMVKTALASGKEKAEAAKLGNLKTVTGVGVVQINADGSYKVVIPEQPSATSVYNAVQKSSGGSSSSSGGGGSGGGSAPRASVPSFEQYFESQHIPVVMWTPETMQRLRDEYAAKYPSANVSVGNLTKTNQTELTQAGLSKSPANVQSFYLNAPSTFRDNYAMQIAAGQVRPASSISEIVAAYDKYKAATEKKTTSSGGKDWLSILSGGTKSTAKPAASSGGINWGAISFK